MKQIMKYWFIFCPLFFMISCDENDDNGSGPSLPVSSAVTAFTAKVTGGFGDEVASPDLLSGTKGVLFVEGSDGARELFNSWLDGNDNPGCRISNRTIVQSNGTIDVHITDLEPETTYSYALFYKSKTGKKRYLGGNGTFTTKSFKPVLNTGEAGNIRYWDAEIGGSFDNLDQADAALFTQGVMLSLEETFTEETALAKYTLGGYESQFSLKVGGLQADKKYYYCIFLKSEEKNLFYSGPIKSFNSKSLDEMAVDMGLSVKWANCDLGTQEYVQYESPNDRILFSWGCTEPSTTMNVPKDKYKYWNSASGSYIDIGSNICGTEYDAAHVILGGKWRMPTKEELDELLACETKPHWKYNYADPEQTIVTTQTLEKITIVGPNKNSIDLFMMYYWTGNMAEENKPWMLQSGLNETGHATTGFFCTQERAHMIRPVCDY